jgi:hypothetical protein
VRVAQCARTIIFPLLAEVWVSLNRTGTKGVTAEGGSPADFGVSRCAFERLIKAARQWFRARRRNFLSKRCQFLPLFTQPLEMGLRVPRPQLKGFRRPLCTCQFGKEIHAGHRISLANIQQLGVKLGNAFRCRRVTLLGLSCCLLSCSDSSVHRFAHCFSTSFKRLPGWIILGRTSLVL